MSMRKSRKLISLAIAVVFLLSAMVPAAAFAAGHTDQDQAGLRLKALGVIEGYPDGSLGVDRTITRAEMSVVLAKMSGNDSASRVLMNVPSTFSDVQTGVWYTGYINLASQQGWVAGYPDGTYKPNAQVSYAEAVTMMLNVLGYEGARLPGTWPSNYLVKAAQLGITDGVSFTANSPALRGDVFIFASATLDEFPVTWNSDTGRYDKDDDPLLDSLGLDVRELRVTNSFTILGSSDVAKEDRLVDVYDYDEEDFDELMVAEGLNIMPYVGVKGEFYVNDDVIVAVKSTEIVRTGEIDGITEVTANQVWDVEFDGLSGTYRLTSDDVVVINNQILPTSAWGAYFAAFEGDVTYTRTSRDITSINIVDYDLMRTAPAAEGGFGIVEEVVIDDNFVDIEVYAGFEANLDLDDVEALYFFGVNSVDEIEEWDVVYWAQDGEDYAIYVVRDQVEGSLTRYRDGDFARIAGTNYDVSISDGLANYWLSSDMGDSVDEYLEGDTDPSFEDFSGESVIGLLDGYGDLVMVVSDFDAVDKDPSIALTTSEIERNLSFGSFTYRVRLLRSNGTEARYTFDGENEDNIAIDGTSIVSSVYSLFNAHQDGELNRTVGMNDQVVEYSFDDDGDIDLLTFYSPEEGVSALTLDEDDLARNRIFVDGEGFFYVTSDSVFFESHDGIDDPEVLSWDDIKDVEGTFAARLYADNDRDIIAIVFETEVVDIDEDYAVVIDTFRIGDDDYVELATADGLREYVLDNPSADWVENRLVKYEVSGGEATLTAITEIVYGVAPSSPYDSTRERIKIGTGTYDLDVDVVVIDNSGSTPTVVAPSAVRRNDYLIAGIENGLVKVMVIADGAGDNPYLD